MLPQTPGNEQGLLSAVIPPLSPYSHGSPGVYACCWGSGSREWGCAFLAGRPVTGGTGGPTVSLVPVGRDKKLINTRKHDVCDASQLTVLLLTALQHLQGLAAYFVRPVQTKSAGCRGFF